LVESSPHDFFWGRGVDGTGENQLGVLLMRLRSELASSHAAVPLNGVAGPERGLRELAAAGGP
jgi:hypothetical protein